MKKSAVVVLALLLLLGMAQLAWAGPRVVVNGQTLNAPTYLAGGTTLVPFRAIFESLGASVGWEQASQTVTGSRGDITVKLRIGQPYIYRNNQASRLDVAPCLLGGYTMVPLRVISESFGANVTWDNRSQTVTIQTAAQALPGNTYTVAGTVLEVLSDVIIFRPDSGSDLTLALAPGAEVSQFGGKTATASLARGMRAVLTVSNRQVTKIAVTELPEVQGRVDSLKSRTITIIEAGDKKYSYGLASNVSVKIDGAAGSLSDIEADMKVTLTFNSNGEVSQIKVTEIKTGIVKGEVLSIKTTGSKKITIEDSRGKENSYSLISGVTVKESSKSCSLSDVEEGQTVTLTLNRDNEVTKIVIEKSDENEIDGEVTNIKTTGSKKITIEDSRGKSKTYYLASRVTVKEGSKSASLSDVEEGQDVTLTLNSDDEVTKIVINSGTGSETVSGRVTGITISSKRKEVAVKLNSGKEKTYNLAKSCTVKENGKTRSIDDVEEDMRVKLTLNSKDEVTKIEIL
ncbi:hypothetical protein JCM39194_22110 [Desulfotomaculum varum]